MNPSVALPVEPAREPGARSGGIKLLLSALRAQRRGALCGVLAGVSWTLVKLSIPILVRRGIDLGIRSGGGHALALIVAEILALGLLGACLAGLRRYFGISVAARVEADLRARLFVHVLRLDLAFHARTPAGELVSRSASDLQQIQQPFVNIPLTVSNAVMLTGATVLLARVDPTLATIALSPALLIFFVARQFNAQLGPRAQRLQQAIGALASQLQESLAGIRAIKGLGLEPVERARVSEQGERTYAASLKLNETRAAFLPMMEFLPAAGMVGVLWVGGQRVAAGSLTVGELVQFNYYLLMLIGPLRIAGTTLAQFQRAFVSATLIDSLLSLNATISHGRTPETTARYVPASASSLTESTPGSAEGGAAIRFDRVEFGYDGARPLLEGLDLHVASGETVALVGATGAGKTTLAGLIARFHDVKRGRVTFDGVDVRELPLQNLRASVGMVFEDALLFSGSIRDNIAFAVPDAGDEAVERAARSAGAHDFIVELQGGYAAPVGERGLRLSGGQRQRIALARALLPNPRVLVLDAATSAVDAGKEDEIREALARVMRGRTTLLVAHRAATLRLADRVLVLEAGRIVASGQHETLIEQSKAYRTILATHS